MALTITWDDGVAQPTVFTFADPVVAALDIYRQSITVISPLSGIPSPLYPTLKDFVVGMLAQYAVAPAINKTPTSEILAAQQAVRDATADLNAVVSATITSALVGA